MSTRAPSPVMLSILASFARKPVKSRGESSDGAGHVLKPEVGHFDGRPFNALVARGLVDYFKRCMCEGPCDCGGNGWHITAAGVAALPVAT